MRTPLTALALLAALSCGPLPTIYRFDGGSYIPVIPNSGSYMLPWTGYMIKAGGECVLTIYR